MRGRPEARVYTLICEVRIPESANDWGDIAPGEEVEELSVAPQRADIYGDPARARLDYGRSVWELRPNHDGGLVADDRGVDGTGFLSDRHASCRCDRGPCPEAVAVRAESVLRALPSIAVVGGEYAAHVGLETLGALAG